MSSALVDVLIIPDLHFPHQDKRAVATMMAVADHVKPGMIILLGDLLDCYAISRFDKDPSRVDTLQEEFDSARSFLEDLRARHPGAAIHIKEGNHEERLKRYLWSRAPALASLRCLTIEEQLGLKDLGIKWFGSSEEYKLGDLCITHGSLVRQRSGYTAHGEMFHRGLSGVSGHTHRLSSVWRTTSGSRTRWIEAGCLCSLNPEYGGDKAPDWQHGFVVGNWAPDLDHVSLNVVEIRDGVCVFRGRVFGEVSDE